MTEPIGRNHVQKATTREYGAVDRSPEPAPIPPEDWAPGAVSVATAARMLDMSARTVFSYMKRGDLRWARLGRDRRIPKADVLKLLARE